MVNVNPGDEILASHINAKLDADGSNIKATAHLVPNAGSNFDLGQTGTRWKNAYLSENIDVDGQGWSNLNTLTDAATIATDCNNGNVHTVTLGDNRTLGNPTNMKAGATYIWIIKQDGTGGRILGYDTAFLFPGGTEPVLTTAINAVDILTAISDGTNLYCSFTGDLK